METINHHTAGMVKTTMSELNLTTNELLDIIKIGKEALGLFTLNNQDLGLLVMAEAHRLLSDIYLLLSGVADSDAVEVSVDEHRRMTVLIEACYAGCRIIRDSTPAILHRWYTMWEDA